MKPSTNNQLDACWFGKSVAIIRAFLYEKGYPIPIYFDSLTKSRGSELFIFYTIPVVLQAAKL